MLEPGDVPIPDAGDLVIEIMTGQMIDFDETSTGCAGDLRRDGWRQETT